MAGILKIDGPGKRARRYAIRADGAGLVNEAGALNFARECLAAGELRALEVGGFADVVATWTREPFKSQTDLRGQWPHWLSIFIARAAAK